MDWIGFGSKKTLFVVDWIGLDFKKWTHAQLCARIPRVVTPRVADVEGRYVPSGSAGKDDKLIVILK